MSVIWVAGAIAGWRTFMRLEAVDGRGPEIHLPAWLRRSDVSTPDVAGATRRHAVWLLVKKELHLQEMAFVVAGLHVLGWLVAVLLERLAPTFRPTSRSCR